MNQFRLRSLVKNLSSFLPKPCFYSLSSFNPGTIKDQKGLARLNINAYDEFIIQKDQHQRKHFSLIQPRSSKSLCNGRETKMGSNIESSYEILGCGMILMKNYISLNDQVEIVNLCQELGFDPNGFKERIPDGEKMGLHMMLLGLKWFPPSYHIDDDVLKVPDLVISLVNSAIQDSQPHLNSKVRISSICSEHCAVKFYTNTGRLALHEEHDEESWYYKRRKGWPVVSFFMGDSAEFFYSDSGNVNEADKVLLESGDVLISGNNYRDMFHGLHRIIPNSAPLPFLEKSMLRPGLLNLSFREI